MSRGTLWRQIKFAATRPDLALRRLRGEVSADISPDEIYARIGDVSTIVEAGALDGQDSIRLLDRFESAVVHAFEPVPSAYDTVCANVDNHPRAKVYQLALAGQSGQQTMFVSSDTLGQERPDSSSLLRPTGHLEAMPSVRFDEQVVVDTATLDDWAEEFAVPQVDLLWLDMQGVELLVLRSAPRVLGTVRAVMMEVSREPLYDGMPLYREVVAWMSEQGFELAIDRVSRVFGNALFVRPAKP